MEPFRAFKYCPQCGVSRDAHERTSPLKCKHCGFLYYFNPAAAVASIIVRENGDALFIRRAKEPARGALGLAGGFVDIGETAERALRREIREELDIEVGELQFISSSPNSYRYEGIVYPVLDFIFWSRPVDLSRLSARDDVEAFEWCDLFSVNPDELAFPSMRDGLRTLIKSGVLARRQERP